MQMISAISVRIISRQSSTRLQRRRLTAHAAAQKPASAVASITPPVASSTSAATDGTTRATNESVSSATTPAMIVGTASASISREKARTNVLAVQRTRTRAGRSTIHHHKPQQEKWHFMV
eukprot:5321977-Prymnesium_polylepis.1